MSATATHDRHQEEVQEPAGGHPLGLDTDDLAQDLSQGWRYITKGGWVFLVVLAIVGFFVARGGALAMGTTLTEIFFDWLKVLLS